MPSARWGYRFKWEAAFTVAEDDVNYIHQATVTLTNAQIKALPTTAVTIVAAQGANKIILPAFVFIALSMEAGNEYDAPNANSYLTVTPPPLSYVANDSGEGLTALTNFLSTTPVATLYLTPDQSISATWGFVTYTQVLSTLVNLPLEIIIENLGVNLTGGNSANTMRATAVYNVIDTTTGLLVATA
jgi:hypothetical protein